MMSIKENMSNVITESDSQIAIRAITGAIKVPSIISNILGDIGVLVFAIRYIKFIYYIGVV